MTAIAAICTPVEIVLAADSSVLDDKGGTSSAVVCKIINLETVFAVPSGIIAAPKSNFDLLILLTMGVAGTQTLREAVDSVEQVVKVPLALALKHLRSTDIAAFQKNALQKPPLTITFAGFQNNRPVMANLEIWVISGEETAVVLNSAKRYCPGPDCLSGYASVFVGTTEGSNLYSEYSLRPGFYDKNLIEVAKSFVQMEIDKGLPDFRPPIDVIQLTQGKAAWIQRKPVR